MNVGWGSLERGSIPQAGSFTIERAIRDLGAIAMDFEQRACEIIATQKPDVICRASCITNRFSLPQNIAPYYGLSMKLDEMARRRRIRCIERDESDCRKAFLGTCRASRARSSLRSSQLVSSAAGGRRTIMAAMLFASGREFWNCWTKTARTRQRRYS